MNVHADMMLLSVSKENLMCTNGGERSIFFKNKEWQRRHIFYVIMELDRDVPSLGWLIFCWIMRSISG